MLTLRYNEPVFILMLRGRVGCLRQFHINLSSGCRADTFGQTDRWSDGRTDGLIAWYIFHGRERFYGTNNTYLDLHVKYPICLFYFNKTWNLLQIFIKAPSLKFHENPSSGSHADTRRQTDRRA